MNEAETRAEHIAATLKAENWGAFGGFSECNENQCLAEDFHRPEISC
jgi:hypothetical protein